MYIHPYKYKGIEDLIKNAFKPVGVVPDNKDKKSDKIIMGFAGTNPGGGFNELMKDIASDMKIFTGDKKKKKCLRLF